MVETPRVFGCVDFFAVMGIDREVDRMRIHSLRDRETEVASIGSRCWDIDSDPRELKLTRRPTQRTHERWDGGLRWVRRTQFRARTT